LNQVIENGLLESKVDTDSPVLVNGIGQNTTRAVTCTVVLPGNKINPKTNNYFSYLCKSTMVQQIIPPLQQTNQTQLIEQTIRNFKQHSTQSHTLPEDMITENFQTEIGGTIQGLIGAKHLVDFPVPVMHLSNGLSIYKHSLRPAGGRSKIYCIGGSLPAVTAFKQAYGHAVHDISNMMLHESMIQNDFDSAQSVCFDGDVRDPNVRNTLPALKNESFRHQQGEDDCKTIQSVMLFDTLTSNSTSKQQLDFCVTASNKTKP
jgi:hypothetical protein